MGGDGNCRSECSCYERTDLLRVYTGVERKRDEHTDLKDLNDPTPVTVAPVK